MSHPTTATPPRAASRRHHLSTLLLLTVAVALVTAGTAMAHSPAAPQSFPTPVPSPAPGTPQRGAPPVPLPPAEGCTPQAPTPACPPPTPAPAPSPPGAAPPLPLPLPPAGVCPPSTALPACHPGPAPRPAPPPPPPPGGGSDNPSDWIAGLLTGWLHDWVTSLVRSALGSLLDMLGKSLLATPQLDQIPGVAQVWATNQHLMITAYVLVIVLAGLVVLAYQSLQTRASIKETLPRLAVGFLAASLSLFLGGQAITLANAVSHAVAGNQDGLDTTAKVFTDTLLGGFPHDHNDENDFYILFTGLALAVMLIVVLLTYIVRITLTMILLAGAPLFLMCHALPQTESIAFWWWKAFGGCLAIQIGQSLALITAIKLFYMPGHITLFP